MANTAKAEERDHVVSSIVRNCTAESGGALKARDLICKQPGYLKHTPDGLTMDKDASSQKHIPSIHA